MSKIRSLFILSMLSVAVGIGWLASTTNGGATSQVGPNLSVREDILGSQWVVRVDPGKHTIEAKRAGLETAVATVDEKKGTKKSVALSPAASALACPLSCTALR